MDHHRAFAPVETAIQWDECSVALYTLFPHHNGQRSCNNGTNYQGWIQDLVRGRSSPGPDPGPTLSQTKIPFADACRDMRPPCVCCTITYKQSLRSLSRILTIFTCGGGARMATRVSPTRCTAPWSAYIPHHSVPLSWSPVSIPSTASREETISVGFTFHKSGPDDDSSLHRRLMLPRCSSVTQCTTIQVSFITKRTTQPPRKK